MSQKLIDKLTSGRQYRSVAEITPAEGEERIVEGYATTFNQRYTLYRDADLQIDEQVDSHAFDHCDMSDVILQYDHAGRVFARISNQTLSLRVDAHGLFIRANLSGTEQGRQLYEEIKGGYTSKMSFGFRISGTEETRTVDADGHITYLRTITGIDKLYDVSAVSLPANDATEISARGFIDGVIDKVRAERLEGERRAARIQTLLALNRKETK